MQYYSNHGTTNRVQMRVCFSILVQKWKQAH